VAEERHCGGKERTQLRKPGSTVWSSWGKRAKLSKENDVRRKGKGGIQGESGTKQLEPLDGGEVDYDIHGSGQQLLGLGAFSRTEPVPKRFQGEAMGRGGARGGRTPGREVVRRQPPRPREPGMPALGPARLGFLPSPASGHAGPESGNCGKAIWRDKGKELHGQYRRANWSRPSGATAK
jgi:hypothetical protein